MTDLVETLSKSEINALVNKFRRNSFGKVSDRLVASLIKNGFVVVEGRNHRLTETGIAAVEIQIRSR